MILQFNELFNIVATIIYDKLGYTSFPKLLLH